jgi:hypothetical protein
MEILFIKPSFWFTHFIKRYEDENRSKPQIIDVLCLVLSLEIFMQINGTGDFIGLTKLMSMGPFTVNPTKWKCICKLGINYNWGGVDIYTCNSME